MVEIRNPWGTTEFNGTFSDADTVNMNAYAKAALNHTQTGNDGTFWMTYDDFVLYFDGMVVFGQWGDADVRTTLPIVYDRATPITSLKVTLKNPVIQDVYVQLITDDQRSFMSNACLDPSRFVTNERLYMRLGTATTPAVADFWG